MANVHMYVQSRSGEWVPYQGDGGGAGSGAAPASSATSTPWVYAAASGGITNTSDVPLVAAAGAGKANYLTSMQVFNAHAVTATEVVVKSGSTIIWRGFAAAANKNADIYSFNPPLTSASNAALNFACITNTTTTYVSAQGYTDFTSDLIRAGVTIGEEIFDDAGLLMTADDGTTIYLA